MLHKGWEFYWITSFMDGITVFKFEIYKCGQILCGHKPYFFMTGHNFSFVYECNHNLPNTVRVTLSDVTLPS